MLEAFGNPQRGRDYLIEHFVREFTSVCPKTGQPDFGRIRISYVPDESCIELKSLKLYLQTYRSKGVYYEDVTNLILNALVACCKPKWMRVRSSWSTRGGIKSVVTVEHGVLPPQVGRQPAA